VIKKSRIKAAFSSTVNELENEINDIDPNKEINEINY
jgi:hypothetical protein